MRNGGSSSSPSFPGRNGGLSKEKRLLLINTGKEGEGKRLRERLFLLPDEPRWGKRIVLEKKEGITEGTTAGLRAEALA